MLILEARCGAGGFPQIALDAGVDVNSFDLSLAIEPVSRNHAGAYKACLFQASMYEIPLRKGSFDKIFSKVICSIAWMFRRRFRTWFSCFIAAEK
jgi:hypothetical protein